MSPTGSRSHSAEFWFRGYSSVPNRNMFTLAGSFAIVVCVSPRTYVVLRGDAMLRLVAFRI